MLFNDDVIVLYIVTDTYSGDDNRLFDWTTLSVSFCLATYCLLLHKLIQRHHVLFS